MAFGANSTNPRERRAYAHTKLHQARNFGEAPRGLWFSEVLDDALKAIVAAARTEKGRKSRVHIIGKKAIVLGELDEESPRMWVPHTKPTTGKSMRRDGYLSDGDSHEGFDVASTRDACCVNEDEEALAKTAWLQGNVHAMEEPDGGVTLVVPESNITEPVLTEAFERHFSSNI